MFFCDGIFLRFPKRFVGMQICEVPKVYVYDSPGIMPPVVPNMDIAMKLALCGIVLAYLPFYFFLKLSRGRASFHFDVLVQLQLKGSMQEAGNSSYQVLAIHCEI